MRERQVAQIEPQVLDAQQPSVHMRSAIDSAQERALYSRRIATIEPVFASIFHHMRMSHFTLRGKTRVRAQWQLYCLAHNIEKVATKAMREGCSAPRASRNAPRSH
jgi:Transposase DDE domain